MRVGRALKVTEEKFGVREGLMAAVGLVMLIGLGARLSGCTEDDARSQDTAGQQSVATFSAGDYTKTSIPKEQWKQLCDSASGVTGRFSLGSTRHFRPDAAYLLQNNGPASVVFDWEDNVEYPNYNTHECSAVVTVNGIYDGTTVEQTERVRVIEFIVDDSENVLAHGVGERG